MDLTTLSFTFSKQIASVRKVMAELTQWRADHEEILRCLELTDGLPALELWMQESPENCGVNEESGSNCKAPSGAVSPRVRKGNDAKHLPSCRDQEEPHGNEAESSKGDPVGSGIKSENSVAKITLQSLSACIHAAEKITIGRSMREVREMRSVLQSVNDWIEQCQSLCPRRQSKRRVQPTNKPTFKRLEDFMAEGLAFPVAVTEEVSRMRKHIAEASSWQLNARSVLEKVSTAFAEQTLERMEIWRKEDESRSDKPRSEEQVGQDGATKGADAVVDGACRTAEPIEAVPGALRDEPAPSSNVIDSSLSSVITDITANVGDKGGGGEGSVDQGSDGLDREDELDEAEESNEEDLRQLLTTVRDISVFMPEEMVTERIQRILEWAR